jgi:Aminoglycoside/hydroxyurea antibiotic resistance kinase
VTALEIPDEVVRMNLSANGAAGRAWLGSLPGLVRGAHRPMVTDHRSRLHGRSRGVRRAGRAVSSEEAVLANRDFHLWNVLAAEREPWLVIDPKPLVGERAFDTGHLLRTLLPERLDLGSVDSIVGRLAKELELEPAHVRRWAFVRSVDDALWGLSVGGTDVGWDVRCAHLLAERL